MLRSGTIIYCDVEIGNNFQTGHNVLIREKTVIGNNVLVGSNAVIEGNCKIGSNVRIQSMAYISTNTVIEDKVFVGPNVIMINDKYPIRNREPLKRPDNQKGGLSRSWINNIS
jgi:UDP-3-O-[3-hydroxymyristoyl] glucosamine N-acyltransferase